MPRRRLIILFLVVLLDLLGFSLILPLLPFLAQKLGAGPGLIGLLVGSNATAGLIGAPIVAGLSDRLGHRLLLVLTLSGLLVGLAISGLAASLFLLFASRVLPSACRQLMRARCKLDMG